MKYRYCTKTIKLLDGSAHIPELAGWKIAWADIPETGWAFVVYRQPKVRKKAA